MERGLNIVMRMRHWVGRFICLGICLGIAGCDDNEERRAKYAEKKPDPKPLERTFVPPVPSVPKLSEEKQAGPAMIEFKGEDINQVTGISGKKVLLVFYSPWCTHCAAYRQALVDYATKQKGSVIIVTANADKYDALAREFKVDAVPKTIIYTEGMKLREMVGAVNSTRLAALIDETFLSK